MTADNEGFHSVWAAERLVVPSPPNQGWSKVSQVALEEMSLLSYLAGVTNHVRLGTYVLLAPLRNPAILLRQATTLDILSTGRFVLGLGLGWMKEEFDISSVPMSERGARADELIRFLRKVWADRKVTSFYGRYIKMGPSLFEPKPVQNPIPIWVGGMSVQALRRAGRIGDGWLPNAMVSPEVIRDNNEVITVEAKRHHRAPGTIVRSCRLTLKGTEAEARRTIAMVEEFRAAGANLFIVDFEQGRRSDSEKSRVFAREVMKSF